MYGLAIKIRNFMYDKGIKASARFDLPVISLGNLTVGGTGKTPHTEYLIRLLKDKYPIAVLSRGYKRKSKGFVEAGNTAIASDIGDEPFQMHRKFPETVVAVQEKRADGIRNLLKRHPQLKGILLDDAFQHRQVHPSLSILLIDSNRPVWNDRMLPFGRLREPVGGVGRADIVIFSKCPMTLSTEEKESMKRHLNLRPEQSVYFTGIQYGEISGLRKEVPESVPILAVSGIAAHEPFEQQVRGLSNQVSFLRFSDHHNFSEKDLKQIQTALRPIRENGGFILTTEKDYVRMEGDPLFQSLMADIFYLPIEVAFLEGEQQFQEEIIRHIETFKA